MSPSSSSASVQLPADFTLPMRGPGNTPGPRKPLPLVTRNGEPAWWSMVAAENFEECQPADVSDKVPFIYKEIPSRVKCKIPLRVEESKIPGAGRGVFILKDVKAGELIFSIDRPLLSIVESGYEACSSTCDNCFAMKTKLPEGGYLQTVAGAQLKFEPCKGCLTLFYCSEECRLAAWKSHHEYECEILYLYRMIGTTKYLGLTGDAAKNAAEQIIFHQEYRCMIRLLRTQKLKGMSDDEWAEFLSLESHLEANKQRPRYHFDREMIIQCSASVALMVDETTLLKLYYAMRNNALEMIVPNLKPHHLDPRPCQGSNSVGGIVLDPFASMVNHSCESNTFWINEGTALRFRAARDISAGSELSISYTDTTRDYKTRQETYKSKFNFTCSCEICQKGDDGPTGKLREKILRIENLDKSALDFRGIFLEKTIQDITKAGFGLGAYGMNLMHHGLLQLQINQKDYKKMLRTCLVLYFGVERLSIPPVPGVARLDTLFRLFQINGLAKQNEKSFRGADSHIPALAEKLYLNFYELYVRMEEKWTGGDSKVTKFAKKSFDELLETKEAKESEDKWQYVSLAKKNKDARKEFVANVNELLVWAGLEKLGEKEIL